MKLISIPVDKYEDYRLDVIFDCYKWDPQFLDNNTIAKHVLVISEEEHQELTKFTERLDQETVQAELFINRNLHIGKTLAIPKEIQKEVQSMTNYQPDKHIRLMRYDFHPTPNGWAISEVNSDVPGGFAEATLMPRVASKLFNDTKYSYKSFGDIIINAIVEKVNPMGKIMLVHCTSYSDDRQVMQFLGDCLATAGFTPIYAAADHLHFNNNEAYSILDGNEGAVDAIIRFTPIEWLKDIKPKYWQGYFNTTTISCNHPIAVFTQTKRFPFIWDTLEKNGLDLTTWRTLLPKTIEVNDVKNQTGFIFKPAHGRVGEKISIEEACQDDEYEKIIRDVKKHPKNYIAQKRFISKPLVADNGEQFHVCLGSYCVEGKAAGYYARISQTPRIDSNAQDIPVLIERGHHDW